MDSLEILPEYRHIMLVPKGNAYSATITFGVTKFKPWGPANFFLLLEESSELSMQYTSPGFTGKSVVRIWPSLDSTEGSSLENTDWN